MKYFDIVKPNIQEETEYLEKKKHLSKIWWALILLIVTAITIYLILINKGPVLEIK